MRELERRVLLTVLDRKWREHLYEMDYLREGIGLRAMAQRDPLVEYQREGGDMFNAMMEAFMEEVVGFVFHLEVEVTEAVRRSAWSPMPKGRRCRSAPSGNGQRPHGPAPDRVRARSRRPGRRGPRGRRGLEETDDRMPRSRRGRRDRGRRAGDGAPAGPGQGSVGSSGPRALSYSAPAEDGSVKTARQDRRARPTTRTRAWAATRRARAARARSTRCATAGRGRLGWA